MNLKILFALIIIVLIVIIIFAPFWRPFLIPIGIVMLLGFVGDFFGSKKKDQ